MIKVFTLNEKGKIELTKEELESLLNESFWDGYNSRGTWTYESPLISPTKITWENPYVNSPYTVSTTTLNVNKEDKENV